MNKIFMMLATAALISSCTQNEVSYKLNSTGQKLTYDLEGNVIDSPAPGDKLYGQDASYLRGSEMMFKDNGDGTVTDVNTGLMWQQVPPVEGMTWEQAKEYCENLEFGGYSDWRLPSLKELFSISDFSTGWPYLDTSYFKLASGNVTKDEQFWSSDKYVGETVEGRDNAAFGVNHVTGHIKAYAAGGSRGGQEGGEGEQQQRPPMGEGGEQQQRPQMGEGGDQQQRPQMGEGSQRGEGGQRGEGSQRSEGGQRGEGSQRGEGGQRGEGSQQQQQQQQRPQSGEGSQRGGEQQNRGGSAEANSVVRGEGAGNGSTPPFSQNGGEGQMRNNPMAKQVRAVRGNAYGENNFTDNNDGTITDKATGLMWAKADNGKGIEWSDALVYAEGAEFAGYDDWRLPNVKELQSIVDYSRAPSSRGVEAAIDPIFECTPFVNEAGDDDFGYYWTGTSACFTRGRPFYFAWYVAFGKAVNSAGADFHGAGAVRFDSKEDNDMVVEGGEERYYNFVRLVRDVE